MVRLVKLIQQTAEEAAAIYFGEPGQYHEQHGLGVAIARWAEQDHAAIMRVFQAALSEASCAEANTVIEWLRRNYDRE